MWQQGTYLASLVVALLCLGLLDYRYKLALFNNPRRTLKTLIPAMLVFIIWDILGIVLGIFHDGSTTYRTGLQLGRDFPLEELFFLALLCYVSLLLWLGFGRQDD